MAKSPSLPPFSGRCHVQLLPATAAHKADTARHLRDFRALSPAQALAEAERAMNGMLVSMAVVLVLLVAFLLSGCKASQAGTDASGERATPSKTKSLTAAAPAPAYSAWTLE